MGLVKEKRDQGGHPTADRPGSFVYCACSFFRSTFSSQKKCLFLAPWKISGMINI